MTRDLDLSGCVALVTGASSGIGAATADALAELGAHVAIGYHRNKAGADATRDRIVAAGGTAIAVAADVRRGNEVRALVDCVTADLGPIDVLVNNAGSLVIRRGIRDVTEDQLDDIFALNLKSAVLASQAVAASMIERRRGAIINVVSIAGHTGGGPGAGMYAAAKAALTAYTKSLAKELAPHNVRVTAVSPGVIDTPFHEAFSTPEMMRTFVSMIPLGRVGTSEDIAYGVLYLASDESSFVTGSELVIDGGFTAH